MDDQIADQETRADLRTNLWLNGAVILTATLAVLTVHDVRTLRGHATA